LSFVLSYGSPFLTEKPFIAFSGIIEESIKAMMNDQNLSMFLWGEATMAAVYVQNRSPHHILKNMTPEEAFSGKEAKC
jgi:hypothetical protein